MQFVGDGHEAAASAAAQWDRRAAINESHGTTDDQTAPLDAVAMHPGWCCCCCWCGCFEDVVAMATVWGQCQRPEYRWNNKAGGSGWLADRTLVAESRSLAARPSVRPSVPGPGRVGQSVSRNRGPADNVVVDSTPRSFLYLVASLLFRSPLTLLLRPIDIAWPLPISLACQSCMNWFVRKRPSIRLYSKYSLISINIIMIVTRAGK